MSYPANSLTDPSLAVPFEGKGIDPIERRVQVNARDGIITETIRESPLTLVRG